MAAIDTNMPLSQLDPQGMGARSGTTGPYDRYVGPATTPGPTSAYQKRKVDTQTYPDAFVDRALRVRDSTEQAAWLEQQTYQTAWVLPLRVVNDLVIHVDHFEAWPTFFALTPEMSVAHMLTQTSSSYEVNLARWSLQCRLEHGFMGTPMGQERYNAMLNQFATSMNETANAEVARALLEATDPQQTWLQRHGQMQIEELQNYLRWDLFVFGALQKNPNNPLELINQRVASMMKAYGGRADTIIMTEDLQIYAEMVPESKIKYYLGGPDAVARVNGTLGVGTDQNTGGIFNQVEPIRWLAGNAIFIHRSMVVEGQGEVNPWRRTRQYGEWNILEDTVRDHSEYRSDRRTIFVYNQDIDTMSPLTTRDGILNCMMWDRNGELRNLSDAGGDGAMYHRDARFYPFANEANSYAPIKYLGDLSQEHFDLGDVNKLAVTMINSAYRDDPNGRTGTAAAVSQLLSEASRRLRTTGEVLYGIHLTDEGEFGGVQNALTAFENFAARMRSIMPQSIFLDPANSVFVTPENQSAGATLWETLIYSGAYPIFADTAPVVRVESPLLEALIGSLKTVLADGEKKVEAEQMLDAGGVNAEQRIQNAVAYLRANPDATTMSGPDLNAWVSAQVAGYRQKLAAKDAGASRALSGNAQIAGFLLPGSTPPEGTVFGVRVPGTNAEFTVPDQADPFAPRDGDEEDDGADRMATFRAGQGDGQPQGDFVLPQTTRSQISEAAIPVSASAIHIFSQVIGAAMGRGRSTSQAVRRATRTSIGGRFGAVTEQIGAHMDRDQDYFDTRLRERGSMANAAQRLGLSGLSAAAINAMIGTLSSNLNALAVHGMPMFRKVMAVIAYGMPFNRQTLLTMYDNDILLPVNFLVLRPHVTVESCIIVKCLGGGGAGYTYYANANVMVGDNALLKTHLINMHFYLRSHVHAPRNVFLIPDVRITGYHGGLGVVPITDPSEYQPDNQAPGQPCMLFLMCSYKTTRQTVPNPFDISGHFQSRYRIRGSPSGDRPAFDTIAFYGPLLGLGSMVNGTDLPVLYEHHHNTLVYRGHQEEDDNRGGYTHIEPNTGVWGPKVYKGCKAAREGEFVPLRDVAYGRGIIGM